MSKFFATWFGVGTIPVAPGTFGSVAALPIAYLIHSAFGPMILFVASIIVFIVGIWVSDLYLEVQQIRGRDPKEVVIDEVAGQWLLLAFVPVAPIPYLVGFLLFRLFDIIKPWPISWFDQNIHNGFGIMLDDILAAFMGIAAYKALAIGLFYGIGLTVL